MMLTHTLNQVAKDNQLLDTARDYFRFTTGFFEIINVSATHIYHSALELSPLLSIIRKFYYSQRPCPSPRVVIGTPDSWDDSTASISTTHSDYKSSNWSPCGNFVTVVTGGNVEVRGALALNLLSTLRSTTSIRPEDGLSYSPDGHSLACCSDTAIIIWDTQTGGVVREIDCEVDGDGSELVWSLDGNMIGILSPLKLSRLTSKLTVRVYEVMSGTMQSSGTAKSRGRGLLWAHDKSFLVMTKTNNSQDSMIDIYEVGCTSALTRVEQFHFQSCYDFGAFSPTAYRISITTIQYQKKGSKNHKQAELLILNVHNSEVLLRELGQHEYVAFSPDGNSFAAFIGGKISIWRYTSGCYTRWRELQLAPVYKLQFSPTSLSILYHSGPLLHVLHLDHSPAAPTIESCATPCGTLLDAFPPLGTYILTVHRGESVITITNLLPQNPSPSQFIDTGLGILGMVLTGNVLLVRDSDTVVAWLLTEEGVVSGTFGKRRVDCSDSLWKMPSQAHPGTFRHPNWWNDEDDGYDLIFSIRDEIAAIGRDGDPICFYHIKTGEILKLDKQYPGVLNNFTSSGCDLYHHSLCQYHKTPKRSLPVLETTLVDGWVKDPEGKHRVWLHHRWRSLRRYDVDVNWLGPVTTLRYSCISSSERVVIKF